ncbi:MAG: MFS transporter [Candidatus Omnitrophica bacterium]|nr:MFS transporter [Candidatus Omnitrophota bacterium]
MDIKINKNNLALQFIILMGLVSLFGDIVYEGARGITGPYLYLLGAGAGIVGLITGLGEFLGYALRLPFGFIADRRKAYWGLAVLGYSLILAIPLLALAGNWQIAMFLILLERLGKAIRAPARDTLLSSATKRVGRGFGFGIHEAMDQIGAVIGPGLFALVFLLKGSYRQGFVLLWIPALLMLVFLLIAKNKVSLPQKLEDDTKEADRNLPPEFWSYILFIFFAVSGLVSFPLIAYHFKVKGIFSDAYIPVLYALAMLSDALFALIIGKTYDKIGMRIFIIIPLVTFFIPLLCFSQSQILALGGVILWGMVMANHETVMRAGIADLVSVSHRGFAYGIFNTIYGIGWFLASSVMGFLYGISLIYLILFSIIMSVISLLLGLTLDLFKRMHPIS